MSQQVGLVLLIVGVLVAPSPASRPASGGFPACLTSEETEVVAGDPNASDKFGWSVDVEGDTLVVSATDDDLAGLTDAGSVHVFVRSGTSWSAEAFLTAYDAASQDVFGTSLDLSGDTLIVGASGADHSGIDNAGAAYVFVRSGTSWNLEAKLIASDAVASAWFGQAVALDGDTAMVATDDDQVYVFERSGTSWNEQQKLVSPHPGTDFGVSMALWSDSAVIGAQYDSHSGSAFAGSAYVFVRDGANWMPQQKLTASDPGVADQFGISVTLWGDTVLVGAWNHKTFGLNSAGAAYVFVRSGTSWSEEAKLYPSDVAPGDHFGFDVVLLADTAVIGAPLDSHAPNNSLDQGSAYVFARQGTSWSEEHVLRASDAFAGDDFGYSVANWGDTVVAGAWGTLQSAGSAYVFRLLSPPVVSGYCTAGTSASGCQALLAPCGVPSASAASGFELQVSDVETGKDGLFYFGTVGQQANPWGSGSSFQCILPPVVRTPIVLGSGNVGILCTGAFAQDLNALWCPSCPKASKNPGAGAAVQAQFWYRDPASTSNQTTSLSDAVEFGVAP